MQFIVTFAILAGAALAAGAAQAETYVVLPSPGSIAPATVVVDDTRNNGKLFVCPSFADIAAGAYPLPE